jgi:hypothetical protein
MEKRASERRQSRSEFSMNPTNNFHYIDAIQREAAAIKRRQWWWLRWEWVEHAGWVQNMEHEGNF